MDKPASRLDAAAPHFRLVGRVLLSVLFISAGLHKISGYSGTEAYMTANGVPTAFLPLVILLELAGGLAVLLGLFTRYAALLLAGFCLLAAYLFHYHPSTPGEMTSFLKDIAIAGGLLVLAGSGPGSLALETLRRSP